MTILILIGCARDIDFTVTADEEFVHEVEWEPIEDAGGVVDDNAPDGVDVFADGGSDTGDLGGQIDRVVFEGTLPEGRYDFRVRLSSQGDTLRADKETWRVHIVAE